MSTNNASFLHAIFSHSIINKPKLFALAAITGVATAITPASAELIIADNSPTMRSAVVNNSTVEAKVTPSQESLIKLMQVMRIDQQIQAVIEGKQAAADILQNQGAEQSTSNKRVLEGQLKGILAQYAQIVIGGLQNSASVEELTQAYIDAAQAHYTQSEVDALIAFYETPVGQSILDKNPKIAADFMQKSLPDEDQMQQTQDQFEQLLPQLKQVIKGAF